MKTVTIKWIESLKTIITSLLSKKTTPDGVAFFLSSFINLSLIKIQILKKLMAYPTIFSNYLYRLQKGVIQLLYNLHHLG